MKSLSLHEIPKCCFILSSWPNSLRNPYFFVNYGEMVANYGVASCSSLSKSKSNLEMGVNYGETVLNYGVAPS